MWFFFLPLNSSSLKHVCVTWIAEAQGKKRKEKAERERERERENLA